MINTAAVKARMKALRMTQREAAEKLGYTQAALSLKTNNRRRMTLEETWALAKLMGWRRSCGAISSPKRRSNKENRRSGGLRRLSFRR